MPVPCKMSVKVLKRGLSRTINDCAVNSVASILAFARAGEIGWIVPNCLS